MILGILYLFQKEEKFSDVNGSIELSMDQMEVSKDTTFGKLPKDFPKLSELTIMKPFPL